MLDSMEPLQIIPLPVEIRKQSLIGAEVVLPSSMTLLDLSRLSNIDKDTLRNGLYNHHVLVIRNQLGISPAVLPEIGKLFDETAWNIHSGGLRVVKDPGNILAANKAARIPRAPQVSVIGQGDFKNYEGVDLSLKHVVFELRVLSKVHAEVDRITPSSTRFLFRRRS